MDDPLEYLAKIEEECVAFKTNENPYATQLKIFLDMYAIFQRPQESVADYAKRVRVHYKLLVKATTVTYDLLNPKLHTAYKSSSDGDRLVMNAATDEGFVAYVMIIGADPFRFGDAINDLEKSYAAGNKNFPSTITEAKDFLDRMTALASRKSPQLPPVESSEDSPELSFNTVPLCHICGKKGHMIASCPLKGKLPRADWYITQWKKTNKSPTPGIGLAQTEAFYDL
jgi:hypothetical protein